MDEDFTFLIAKVNPEDGTLKMGKVSEKCQAFFGYH